MYMYEEIEKQIDMLEALASTIGETIKSLEDTLRCLEEVSHAKKSLILHK